ncbi:MAG: hypothetical protein ACRD3B_02115 [Candidatus Sulfotelmatobacter sp.]
MSSLSRSTFQNAYVNPNDVWSKSDKAVARKAFDAALKRELQEAIGKAKRMASQITQPADLWDLENFLTRRREHIDSKYVFRQSRLTEVLGRLLWENRLSADDLQGMREDKLESIRSYAKFFAKMNAA